MPPDTPPTPPAPTRPDQAEPLWRLVLWLPLAVLRRGHDRLPVSWIRLVMSVCGMVAMVTPLLLWVSWTKAMFWGVLGAGGGAIAVFMLLVWLAPGKHV